MFRANREKRKSKDEGGEEGGCCARDHATWGSTPGFKGATIVSVTSRSIARVSTMNSNVKFTSVK